MTATLMKDALRAISCFPDFHRTIEIYLIEASENMIRRQQYTLNAV